MGQRITVSTSTEELRDWCPVSTTIQIETSEQLHDSERFEGSDSKHQVSTKEICMKKKPKIT